MLYTLPLPSSIGSREEVEWQEAHAEMKLSAGPFMRPFHPHDGREPFRANRISFARLEMYDSRGFAGLEGSWSWMACVSQGSLPHCRPTSVNFSQGCQGANKLSANLFGEMGTRDLRLTSLLANSWSYIKVPNTQPIGDRGSTTAKSTWMRRKGEAKSLRSLPFLVDLEMT